MTYWETIDDFPRYEVSSDGQVRNTETGHILKPAINQQGIAHVALQDGTGIGQRRSLAILVAQHHLNDPPHPSFNSPINLDGNRMNCDSENLAWRPRWFAVKYHQQFKRECPVAAPVECLETGEVFENVRQAAIAFGVLEKEIIANIPTEDGVWPGHYHFKFEGNDI